MLPAASGGYRRSRPSKIARPKSCHSATFLSCYYPRHERLSDEPYDIRGPVFAAWLIVRWKV